MDRCGCAPAGHLRRTQTQDNPSPALIDDGLFGCKIMANPDAFHVAARNLMENALQHSGSRKPVRWSLSKSDASALITRSMTMAPVFRAKNSTG